MDNDITQEEKIGIPGSENTSAPETPTDAPSTEESPSSPASTESTVSVPDFSLDYDEIASRLDEKQQERARRAQEEASKKDWDDMSIDEQLQALRDNQTRTNEEAERIRRTESAKNWASKSVEQVTSVMTEEAKSLIGKEGEAKIAEYLTTLATEHPDMFRDGKVPVNVQREVAKLAIGDVYLNGNKGQTRINDSEPREAAGIPNYTEIVKGYKELNGGKTPTLEEVRELSKFYTKASDLFGG